MSENRNHIPLIVYRYTPKPTEIITELLGKPIRRIFKCPIESFDENELTKIIEIDDYIKEQKYVLPDYYKGEDKLRQLQGNDYKIEASYKEIVHEIEWKKEHLPIQLTDDIMKVLNSGFIYVHGRDNFFRPLIFVNPMKFNSKEIPLEVWQNGLYYLIDYMIKYYLVPGKVENWNFIIDCGDLNLKKLPIVDLKALFAGMKGVYRCRLYRLYLLRLRSLFLYLWKMAVAIIGPTVEAKATNVPEEEGKNTLLFKDINPNQVEKKYGGLAEDLKEGELFPETFKCGEFYSEEDKTNGKIFKKCEVESFKKDDEEFYEIMSDED
ncbi:MAG: SEC14 family lipid-binding protein [archaeon]|nr:SEC14 family lipid-binding protein [archaeon]